MVVTDLHGDWPLYQRYRDVFLTLKTRGLVDTLVITGDYLHSNESGLCDGSLEIVLDLLALRDTLGISLVILLGNHELPHIYPFILSKGDITYTPTFEHKMGSHRQKILAFFEDLPFYARTRAGVTLCHAGAFPQAHEPTLMHRLFNYSHRDLKQRARDHLPDDLEPIRRGLEKLLQIDYDYLVSENFAVTGPTDPRYYDYVISQFAMASGSDFDVLWDALFNNNEQEYGNSAYTTHVTALLQQLSTGYTPQRVCVTGHLRCRGGYHIVAKEQQLRIASGIHAKPYTSARYVLFDAGKSVKNARDLITGIGSLFDGNTK